MYLLLLRLPLLVPLLMLLWWLPLLLRMLLNSLTLSGCAQVERLEVVDLREQLVVPVVVVVHAAASVADVVVAAACEHKTINAFLSFLQLVYTY